MAEIQKGPENRSQSMGTRLTLGPLTHLSASPEGRVLLSGLALALVFIGWLGIRFLSAPEDFQVLVGMTATHVLFGRAAGMSFGYALGYGHGIVVSVNMTIETIMVMTCFPLFVLGWERMLVVPMIDKAMDRMRAAAEANRDTIRKYGIPGLFVFVCIPFWMTGPLVGSIVGYFLHLSTSRNMLIVLGGTYVATLGWAVVLKELHERVSAFDPYAPIVLLLVLVAIVVAGHFLAKKRH